MAFNWREAFEADIAIAVEDDQGNTIYIGAGANLPHGSDAPTGSFYIMQDGTFWKKFTSNDDDWRLWPQASEVPFTSDGDDFPEDIDDTQEAIEYAKRNAEGFPRAGLSLVYNGTVGNNDWISYSNLTPNVPILFPVKTKLNELTWANNNDDRSFDLELYRVAIDGETLTLVETLEVRNSPTVSGYWTEVDMEFQAGEALKIRYKDQGKL